MNTQEERVPGEDLRDAISNAFDQISAEPEEVETEVVEPVEIEATEETTEESEAVEAVAESNKETEEAEAIEGEFIPDPFAHLDDSQKNALEYMGKDMREMVEKLDESLQNELINHHIESEKAYRKKTLGIGGDLELAQGVRELLAPVALNGLPEQQYIAQLIQQDAAMRANPAGTVEQLAKLHGQEIVKPERGFEDPLQKELNELKQMFAQQQQNTQQNILQQAQKQVDDFAADKPDFDSLEPLILRKVQGGMDLQKAYESVKGELGIIAPVQASNQRVPIKQKKKAASGVKSTNSTVQQNKPMTLREEIEANYNNLGL